jgi:hypothetical protein
MSMDLNGRRWIKRQEKTRKPFQVAGSDGLWWKSMYYQMVPRARTTYYYNNINKTVFYIIY